MKKIARLIRDCFPFKKGTEFEVTNEDDGFYSLNPFYAGRINGRRFSCLQDAAKILYNEKPTGFVEEMELIDTEEDEWWEYTKYP